MDEIQANDFNLNISRYVDTTEAVAVMSVKDALARLREAERKREEAVAKMDQLLAEPWVCQRLGMRLGLSSGTGGSMCATRGSHRHFLHPEKPGKVTIPGHPGDDLPPGTWQSIQEQAGLRGRER